MNKENLEQLLMLQNKEIERLETIIEDINVDLQSQERTIKIQENLIDEKRAEILKLEKEIENNKGYREMADKLAKKENYYIRIITLRDAKIKELEEKEEARQKEVEEGWTKFIESCNPEKQQKSKTIIAFEL